jgi:hypothetical protein
MPKRVLTTGNGMVAVAKRVLSVEKGTSDDREQEDVRSSWRVRGVIQAPAIQFRM